MYALDGGASGRRVGAADGVVEDHDAVWVSGDLVEEEVGDLRVVHGFDGFVGCEVHSGGGGFSGGRGRDAEGGEGVDIEVRHEALVFA